MIWNHRVVDLTAENGGEPLFGFREVYYGEDGKHHSFCDTFMESEDLDGLRQLVDRLQKALSEPVVKFEAMELRYCRACETEVDALNGKCTQCGQPTEPLTGVNK